MAQPPNDLLNAALDLHAHGYSVVPARADGTKAPAALWKQYQGQRPTLEQLHDWFSSGTYDGLGVITGAVSGNLEMFELEGRATGAGIGKEIAELADSSGLGDLWETVTSGYLEMTPSGGFHILYRVEDDVPGNTKLARRPATEAELADNPGERIKVLIETRGEGGFTITAPSAGRTHPEGGAWILVRGGPSTIATITVDEHRALHVLAQAFDSMPQAAHTDPIPLQRTASDGTRPGDDYNARTSWADILGVRGWTVVYRDGADVTYWRRPGKREGISATTGKPTVNGPADNLYVFSTSTEFDAETPYSKFAAYTLLEHDGDWKAATKALGAAGYGTSNEPFITIPDQTFTPTLTSVANTDDGNLATVHELKPSPAHPAGSANTTLERSDDGNALALIADHGDAIRFCSDRDRWLWWDGQRWQWQPARGGIVRELAKATFRNLPDNDSAAATHKRKSLGAKGITDALQQASTDRRVVVTIDDLDANPWELNTPDGVIDLRTGTVAPARPEQLHTRVTATGIDLDADQSAWLAFLADTFGDDVELIAYLQRLVGYSAVGIVGPHVLPFCHGSGGNGKGVFLEACAGVLGDYATTAPVGFLMGRGFTGHETEIARLAGARMVICSEVNEDDIFDEAKVKQLTGGDTLTARFMRQDHFTFKPSHQLWLMGNSQPSVRTGGRAFWRRIRLVPFTREVPAEKMVDDLQNTLVAEHGPAIMAWIAAGAAAYATAGLQEPSTVKAATDDYAANQDTVGRFLDDRCLLGGGDNVKLKVSIVREAYEAWCRAEGEQPVTAKAFGIAMQRKGVSSLKGSRGVRLYSGISMLGDEEDAPHADADVSFNQPANHGSGDW